MERILTQEEIDTLEDQGLHEQIRNCLSPIKNFIAIHKEIQKTSDPTIKIKLEQLLNREDPSGAIEKILAVLQYDENKKMTP
jgi:hypothetical protein